MSYESDPLQTVIDFNLHPFTALASSATTVVQRCHTVPGHWSLYICSHTPNVDVSDLVYIVPLVLLRAIRVPAIVPSVSSRMVPRTSRAIALASPDGKIVDPNEDTIVEEMEEPPPRCVDNCSVSPVSTITRR